MDVVIKLSYLKEEVFMEVKEVVLNKMKEMGRPVTAGEVELATGLERKEVDKAFNTLKKRR